MCGTTVSTYISGYSNTIAGSRLGSGVYDACGDFRAYDWMGMNPMSHFRRLIVFLCVAALLLAVLAPVAAALPLAIFLTGCFVIAISLSVPLRRVDELILASQALAFPAFSPRPPPTL